MNGALRKELCGQAGPLLTHQEGSGVSWASATVTLPPGPARACGLWQVLEAGPGQERGIVLVTPWPPTARPQAGRVCPGPQHVPGDSSPPSPPHQPGLRFLLSVMEGGAWAPQKSSCPRPCPPPRPPGPSEFIFCQEKRRKERKEQTNPARSQEAVGAAGALLHGPDKETEA